MAQMMKALTDSRLPGLTTRYYRLEKLTAWEHLNQVNKLLLDGISPIQVAQWCRDNNFFISNTKMYEYKELLLKAIDERKTVADLLGVGTKAMSIRKPIKLPEEVLEENAYKVKNELEFLDLIIQKGYEQILSNKTTIKLSEVIKAIEMKQKITEGLHGGLTNWGLQQVQALEQAKFMAVLEVVKRYLPQDRIEELEQDVAEAEVEFYRVQAPEYLEEYERSKTEE